MKFLQAVAGVALGVAGVAAQSPAEGVSRADLKLYNDDILKNADLLSRVIRSDNCKPKDDNNKPITATRDGAVQKFLKGLGKPKCIRNFNSKDKDGKVTRHMAFGFKDGTVMKVDNNLGDGGSKITCFGKSDSFCPDKVRNTDPKEKQADQLRKLFKAQDKDGSGKIPSGAAYTVLQAYLNGNKDTKALAQSTHIEQLLDKLTTQKSQVSLSEIFCISKYLTKVGEAYDLFKNEDKSNDEHLDIEETEDALKEFYMKYSRVQVPDDCKTPACTAHLKQIQQQAKTAAESFFKSVDKDGNKKIDFNEYESDAFSEIHYRPQDCQAAAKPTLEKENDLIKQIYYKFAVSDGDKSSMSSEDFYQFSAQLDSRISLKYMGCENQKNHITNQNIFKKKQPTGSTGFQRFSPASTVHRFLQAQLGATGGQRPTGPTGGQRPTGGQQPTGGKPQPGGTGGRPVFNPVHIAPHSPAYVKGLADGASDMLEDAYQNTDKLGYSDFLKGMQNMKDDLEDHNDFDKMLQYASTLKPVDCKQFKSCRDCTARAHAGLCGWTASSKFDFQNKNQGRCSFVDKDEEADNKDNSADVGTETCLFKCPNMRPQGRPGQKPTGGSQQKPGQQKPGQQKPGQQKPGNFRGPH